MLKAASFFFFCFLLFFLVFHGGCVCTIIIIITAVGLSPGANGYFTCIQNMKLVTNKFKLAGLQSRLRSRNACYHSVQDLLSSRLLSKNLKIKIYIEL